MNNTKSGKYTQCRIVQTKTQSHIYTLLRYFHTFRFKHRSFSFLLPVFMILILFSSNGTYKNINDITLKIFPVSFHVHMYMYLSFLFVSYVCCHLPIQIFCQLILCSSSSQSFSLLEAFYVSILLMLYSLYNVE